jgi:ceroid-lipofuscinosis MFS transporter 7
MGLLTATGSLARILGPIFASYVYEKLGTYWLFSICVGSVAVAGLVTTAAYTRLVPIETRLARRRAISSQP